jgi:thiamine pyrophosphokinase
MRATIIANGSVSDPDRARAIAAQAELLICADGGTQRALEWGLRPDLIVGDLDSLDAGALQRLVAEGVAVERHPTHKDETDLELALDAAVRLGASEIDIVGAWGGRLDQTIANVLLLAAPRYAGVPITIHEGADRLFLAQGTVKLRGRPGDLVSLIPLSAEVTDITTAGLQYPLRGESLFLGLPRGVSNTMLGEEATIRFGTGLLLICHRRET